MFALRGGGGWFSGHYNRYMNFKLGKIFLFKLNPEHFKHHADTQNV